MESETDIKMNGIAKDLGNDFEMKGLLQEVQECNDVVMECVL